MNQDAWQLMELQDECDELRKTTATQQAEIANLRQRIEILTATLEQYQKTDGHYSEL